MASLPKFITSRFSTATAGENQKVFDTAVAEAMAQNPAKSWDYVGGGSFYTDTIDNFRLLVWQIMYKKGQMGDKNQNVNSIKKFWIYFDQPAPTGRMNIIIDASALYNSKVFYGNQNAGASWGSMQNTGKDYYNATITTKWEAYKQKYAKFFGQQDAEIEAEYEKNKPVSPVLPTPDLTNTNTETKAGMSTLGYVLLAGLGLTAIAALLWPSSKPPVVTNHKPSPTPRKLSKKPLK